MTGARAVARVVLMACLVCVCRIAWGADAPVVIPAGARIGVMDLVTNDITHFHAGRTEMNSFLRTYRSNWGPADLIDAPLMMSLTAAGFTPVGIRASDELWKDRDSWFIEKPRAHKLPRGCLKELTRVMTEQKLAALIVVAPGANTDPEFVEGDRWSRLPKTTQGFGFLTSDEPSGIRVTAFDFTQMVVVAPSDDDGATLVARDWGADRAYDWPGFDAGANLKALPNAQVAQLGPVLADAIQKRITTRLIPKLKP